MDVTRFMKRESISDSRSAENTSDRRLRTEVQPALTNGVERVKRLVNVNLRCIVSNLNRISKHSTLHTLKKFLRTPMFRKVVKRLKLQEIVPISMVWHEIFPSHKHVQLHHFHKNSIGLHHLAALHQCAKKARAGCPDCARCILSNIYKILPNSLPNNKYYCQNTAKILQIFLDPILIVLLKLIWAKLGI